MSPTSYQAAPPRIKLSGGVFLPSRPHYVKSYDTSAFPSHHATLLGPDLLSLAEGSLSSCETSRGRALPWSSQHFALRKELGRRRFLSSIRRTRWCSRSRRRSFTTNPS